MDDYYAQRFVGHGFQPSNQPTSQKTATESIDLDGFAPFAGQPPDQTRTGQNAKLENRSDQSRAALATPQGQAMDVDQPTMVRFGGGNSGSGHQQVSGQSLSNFQFDPSSNSQQMLLPAGSVFTGHGRAVQSSPFAQHAGQGLHLNTQNSTSSNFHNAISPAAAYQSPLDQNSQLNMQMPGQYISQSMPMGMDYSPQSFQTLMNSGPGDLDMLQQSNQYHSSVLMSPTTHGYRTQANPHAVEQTRGKLDRRQSMPSDQLSLATRLDQARPQDSNQSNQTNLRRQSSAALIQRDVMRQSGAHGDAQHQRSLNADVQQNNQGWHKGAQDFSNSIFDHTAQQSTFENAYSSTGFDMMTVLMKVATRPNPEINIGAVDLSCAFVVCDAFEHDFPIVYCSENFERLTGYTKHEILHRNCRFLQSPDGKVQAGVKRSYVDDESVLYLKNMITARREAQVSLINYRKGGQPFMNLLTMIPITYDSSEIRFFVGFQVDLVEQPHSVTNKNPDGSYTINYQRGLAMPRYVFTPNEKQPSQLESGQTIPRDDVSAVLSTIGTGESDFSKRIWDKVLLENTDDVVLVLSLKGLFLYLSPSSSKVLEYNSSELTGTALSSICHPSDIVAVTRELRETSASSFVNIAFRILRKNNGYMWFEGHGSLCTEQGKGRKSIVLVGRERPVYTLSKTEILAVGGIGDNEIWSKLSTSGMFLFVASNVRQLLDKLPEDLVGTSMQALMRQESRSEFLRVLEIAKTGKRASSKHELLNKRGQVLQAFSTFYPGDAVEGQKPTFVIAQTRLLKYSRPSGSQPRPQTLAKLERESNGSVTNASHSSGGTLQRMDSFSGGNSTSQSLNSPQRFMSTFEAALTYSGQQGLLLGHQDIALASDENLFDELKTTRSTSWQYELHQMAKRNRRLAEELQGLLAARKKRKRRKGNGQLEKDCANCHTRVTPEWRRGPSGNRDLCNSCGLRWAKQQGRISPRTSSQRSVHSAASDKASVSALSQVQQSPTKQQPSIGSTLAEAVKEENAESGINASSQQLSSRRESDAPTKAKKSDDKPPAARRNSGEMHSGDPGIGSALPPKIEESAEESEPT